jgi:pimeloyl-ACP methyl ester carboxylesterase
MLPRLSLLPQIAFLITTTAFGAPALTNSAAEAPPAATVIPIRNFFRPPSFERPQVNSSGSQLAAFVELEDNHTAALLVDLKSGKKITIKVGADRDIERIDWLDNRYLLLGSSEGKNWADAMFVVDTENPDQVHAIERNSVVKLVGIPTHSPMKPVIWISHDAYHKGVDGGVVQIDAMSSVDETEEMDQTMRTATGARTAVEANGTAASIIYRYPDLPRGRPGGYLSDRNGELAYGVAIEDGIKHLFILRKSVWVPSPLDLDRYEPIAAGDADDELLAIGPRQEGKPRALLRVNAVTGQMIATLYQDDRCDPDVRRVLRHPGTGAISGIDLYRGKFGTIWFDSDCATTQAQLNKVFPGMTVELLDGHSTRNRIIVGTSSDRSPAAYYFFDRSKVELQPIMDIAPGIPVERMRPKQSMTFKARDGCAVDCYLTLPENAARKKPLPLVVLVHGGPSARDEWEWDPEVQFLASRGYAVFQPNYRGSTGYDWRFPVGDDWKFRKMHQDVTDGVRQLLQSDWFDPQRAAIMGGSFGGYLAVCGAAYEPGLYRCAITEAGVFDWTLMMNAARREQRESLRYEVLRRFLGDPKQSQAEFAEISPLDHIDQVKIPVLIAHGRSDPVVSVEQSKRLIAELKRRKVPCEVLIKSGEGHGMSRLDDRVELYTMVEAFLARNLAKP